MNEIWKDVKGYEGMYMVSNLGRIRSLDRIITQGAKNNSVARHPYKGRILKPIKQNIGYLTVTLKGKIIHLHRLIAETFIPNPLAKPFINHKDGKKDNNTVDNLEWVTAKENSQHAWKTGLSYMTDAHREAARHSARKGAPKHWIPIEQYTKDGEYIQTFNSIREASQRTGANQTHISLCAKGKHKTCGGYIWKYTK